MKTSIKKKNLMNKRSFLKTIPAAALVMGNYYHSNAFSDFTTQIPNIPQRTLGKTGVKISSLIIGGVVAMKEPPTKEFHPAALANAALDKGINYFDTAPAYGNGQSEKNYGEIVKHRRNEVFLATKTLKRNYDEAMKDIENSLKRLQTDSVDLLQIHSVGAEEDITDWGRENGIYTTLQKLKDEKVTRFIGVTGHESAQAMLNAITMYEFDTILTTFNPTTKRRPYQELVLPVAQKKNMGILAMKVMGGGLGSLSFGNPIENDGASNHDEAPKQASPESLIQYVLGLPVSAAVVGMNSLAHLKVNVNAAKDLPPLNEQERKQLETELS